MNYEYQQEDNLSIISDENLLIVGHPHDNTQGECSGSVYVYRKGKTFWEQEAYLKASNIDPFDEFGGVIALDGDTLVVSAKQEESTATGINGNQNDNSAEYAGAVYVFRRINGEWTQEAYIKAQASNGKNEDEEFGCALAISGDLLVVGSYRLDMRTGMRIMSVIHVYHRNGSTWVENNWYYVPFVQYMNRRFDSIEIGDSIEVKMLSGEVYHFDK